MTTAEGSGVSGESEPTPEASSAPSSAETGRTRPFDLSPDETEAFSAFYTSHMPRLILFLQNQGVPLADAADCAQETMIEALQCWRSISLPYPWCRRVAARKW